MAVSTCSVEKLCFQKNGDLSGRLRTGTDRINTLETPWTADYVLTLLDDSALHPDFPDVMPVSVVDDFLQNVVGRIHAGPGDEIRIGHIRINDHGIELIARR